MFYLAHFRSLGQKSKNNFVGFLVQMRTRNFAFEIYWPLANMAKEWKCTSRTVQSFYRHGAHFFLFQLFPKNKNSYFEKNASTSKNLWLHCACWHNRRGASWWKWESIEFLIWEKKKNPFGRWSDSSESWINTQIKFLQEEVINLCWKLEMTRWWELHTSMHYDP